MDSPPFGAEGGTRTDPDHRFEYLSLNEQRMALERAVHLWHIVCFPAAVFVFIFFLTTAIDQHARGNYFWVFLSSGLVLSTLIVLFARYYTSTIDQEVVRLYPRIIALEIMLGYRFLRDLLKAGDKKGAGREFIERCEKIDAGTASELWEKIEGEFDPKYFPGAQRGHRILDWTAMIMIIVFVAVTLLTIASLRPLQTLTSGIWT